VIAEQLVELREQMALCQAARQRLEASAASAGLEVAAWETGALVGAAYAVTQHVARPLWERHFQTIFPPDRCLTLIMICLNLMSLGRENCDSALHNTVLAYVSLINIYAIYLFTVQALCVACRLDRLRPVPLLGVDERPEGSGGAGAGVGAAEAASPRAGRYCT